MTPSFPVELYSVYELCSVKKSLLIPVSDLSWFFILFLEDFFFSHDPLISTGEDIFETNPMVSHGNQKYQNIILIDEIIYTNVSNYASDYI